MFAPLLCALASVRPDDALSVRDLAPFARLDAAVRALPVPSVRTPASVAKGLATLAASPTERARAAYVWTTAHLAYSLDRRDLAGALRDLAGDCEAHAAVYAALAKAMGVECEMVTGHVRFALPPGAALAADTKPLAEGQWLVSHAWNAVRVGERWGLVDTTMGSKSGKAGAVEDDYFLPDPAVMATDHVPADARWTLGEAPADLARTPLIKPFAWRAGIERGELEPRNGVLPLAWRKGLRASLQTAAGNVSDRALAQPSPNGTELRLSPTGTPSVAWLGLNGEGGWHPLVGYPVVGTPTKGLPKLMKEFYDTGAVLAGPFGRDLAAGREATIRLKAPGASAVVAFQGPSVTGQFAREGDDWVLRATPASGAALEVMASYADPGRFQALVTYEVE